MAKTFPRTGRAARQGHSLWRTRLSLRRARIQWQLLTVVTLIAILASTLIASLTLLVSATELGAARGALSGTSTGELRVILSEPEQPTDAPRERVVEALDRVLGDAATSTSTSMALTRFYWVSGADDVNRLVYIGDVENVRDNAILVTGDWPETGSTDEVAIPEGGAAALGLGVGDTLATVDSRAVPALELTISGLYRVEDPDPAFWGSDRLDGAGHDPEFIVPGTGGSVVTDAVGPLVVASGALDAAAIPVDRYVVRVTPDFSAVTVESLNSLAVRLATAPKDAPAAIGEVADGVDYISTLDPVVRSVTSAMAVTRSTVVAVSLLLLVLAIAALAQAARLLTEARVGERHLMRARGSSSSQILGLAVVEAALIAALAAGVSPLLARGAYAVVAGQPAMVASGMAADAGLPPHVWLVALVTAVLFGLVLVAPLIRREGSFHEGEQGNARQQRFSGLQRSGVDVALIVLAGVAYWQLLSYESAPGVSAFGVDPVLAAGPVLILLAGSLIAVRLVPTVARFTERIAERSRGAVVALAAWEVGRRAQRATAAILLLTLALAVGTFSLSFLSTWRQSQLDQAAFALGAPMRVTADEGDPAVPRGAEPVIRLEGIVGGGGGGFSSALGDPSGDAATIVALTQDARDMLARGRLAESGGSVVSERLDPPKPLEQVIDLPERTTGLSATVRIEPVHPTESLAVRLSVLVEDDEGVQSIISLGSVDADGQDHDVRGLIPDGKGHNGLAVIAYQAQAYIKNPMLNGENGQTTARLLIKNLGALGIAVSTTPLEEIPVRPVTVGVIDTWRASGEGMDTTFFPRPLDYDGWQIGLSFTVPETLGSRSASYSHTSWPIVGEVQAVLSTALADGIHAKRGDSLSVIAEGVAVPIYVKDVVAIVPGTGATVDFGPLGGGPSSTDAVVVLDEDSFVRALYQAGRPTVASEWWADVAPGDSEAFVSALDVSRPTLHVQSAEQLGLEMQQHPVRVATQAALWLVIAGALALATAGFAVHATGSLRSRATEFAQLRAVGLTRQRLVGIIGIESLLLCVLGAVFGVGLGLILAWLVAPLVGVSADGLSPIPSVQVHVPALDVLAMVGVLGVVLAAVVLIAARVQRVAEPATALRQGEER